MRLHILIICEFQDLFSLPTEINILSIITQVIVEILALSLAENGVIFNNYSPKWRWLVVDINLPSREAAR